LKFPFSTSHFQPFSGSFLLTLQKNIQMKNYFIVIALVLGICSVSNVFGQAKNYGAKIDDKGVMAMGDLVKQMQNQDKMKAKVEGKVSSVCQAKGCWMMLETGNGNSMRVTFKDYEFFVPKDIAGKTVIIEGVAEKSTTSVEELRHYAQDAKKSKEEIEKITEPKSEMVFEAVGVIVK
jgi:hypothetical protein